MKALQILGDEIQLWAHGWRLYLEKKLALYGKTFEGYKDVLVDILVARRGSYQRPFLHVSLGILAIAGFISAPILARAYPGGVNEALAEYSSPSTVAMSLDFAEYGIQTTSSDKPRDQVITHTVVSGDTLVKIADKYSISVDTIKWANDLKSDSLSVGVELKIPPVTGVIHRVREGETVYSIAKKYKTDAQKIVNFPFNDFSDLDSFALNVGQSLIVPDGAKEEAVPVQKFVTPLAPIAAGGSGQFMWPTNGVITQYPIWYHMALDIANPSGPAVVASGDGVVSLVQYLRYGYGQHIVVQHDGGLATLYGHLQEIYVKPGDRVSRGQVIGKMGSTGRSTGTHLHFEVRKDGVTQNPLPYLK